MKLSFSPSIPGSFNGVRERQIRKLTRRVQSCNYGRSKASSSKVITCCKFEDSWSYFRAPSRNMATLTDLSFDFHISLTLVSWLRQWKIMPQPQSCRNFCTKLVYIATLALKIKVGRNPCLCRLFTFTRTSNTNH